MQKTIRAASLALGAFALAGLSTGAQAAWTFSNDSGGDGSIAGGYPAFEITGSDNGAGDNTTFYTQILPTSASYTFTWSYGSLDAGGTVWDSAGFIVGDTESQLSLDADAFTPSSGTRTVVVGAGQLFGFYVHSSDSTGGAGYLAINEDLTLPSPPPPPPPPPAIPEPQAPLMMLAGLAGLFAAARRRSTIGQ